MRSLLNNSSQKPVIVLGAGGHAKVVADVLTLSGAKILGFVTPDIEPNTSCFGFNVLGDDDIITSFSPDDVLLVNGIGMLPKQNLRRHLATRLRDLGYSFKTIVHPLAVIAEDVRLSEGVQVMAGVIIQPGTQIGRDTIINTGVLIDHDCCIAQNCHLAPGVVCSGNVNIEEGSHIGIGTSVIQNISIGKHSVIAAGSVIYKNVPEGMIFIQERQAKQKKIKS